MNKQAIVERVAQEVYGADVLWNTLGKEFRERRINAAKLYLEAAGHFNLLAERDELQADVERLKAQVAVMWAEVERLKRAWKDAEHDCRLYMRDNDILKHELKETQAQSAAMREALERVVCLRRLARKVIHANT